MKVGLILPGNIWFCPYVKIYTKIFDKLGVAYDYISWNRDGKDGKLGYQYTLKSHLTGRLSKIIPYVGYTKFIKQILNKNHYDRLIVFGPQLGIFLYKFLEKKYKDKYLFDYRDLSIEQLSIFKYPFKRVLTNSYANVISSPGFKKCLPNKFKYLLSHNFDVDLVLSSLNAVPQFESSNQVISVLTIGGIRDFTSNLEVVKALANNNDFTLGFVGKGDASDLIKKYVLENNISNVTFEGFYPKELEADYIIKSTFINIYYPKIISHITALSNRFYNSLIYKRPMIVTSGSVQGDYVEKYKLGLSVNNCDDLGKKLKEYMNLFNEEEFVQNCNRLLEEFLEDYKELERTVISFVSSK